MCGTYNQVTCYNNGTCYNDSCVCPYPYTGYDCSFTVGKRLDVDHAVIEVFVYHVENMLLCTSSRSST